MAKAKKILFITQEMTPYVPESAMTKLGMELPHSIQERKCEIRTFMPKWGIINERRNQLHEVIRLSGMNLIIDDTDHPLIIKVASITSARIQVYFIDNDDYFLHRAMSCDENNNKEYTDNAERAVFYARGVLETVKKLRWTPEIIHCQGWISSILPLYIKTAYREEPSFRDCKVVYTPSEENLHGPLPGNFDNILKFRTAGADAVEDIRGNMDTQLLNRLGMKYADGVSFVKPEPSFRAFAEERDIPFLAPQKPEDFGEAYSGFYDKIWSVGRSEEIEEEED